MRKSQYKIGHIYILKESEVKLMHKRVAYLSFIILLAGLLFISGCASQNGGGTVSCQNTTGMTACGYCAEDAAFSDNPNAGQCRYCPSDTKCSYANICGELKCENTNLGPNHAIQVLTPVIPDATVGVPFSYSFATMMEPSGGNPPYTFYLGSGVGFPPTGLILDANGILRGIPKMKGTSRFEVCVKDVGGDQACKTVSMNVNPADVNPSNHCFATSTQMANPCHSIKNGIETYAVVTFGDCNCPSDTTFAQMDNTAPGGPYKICACN